MLPIQALSIRMWATMFPPSSATAIFIGCPISFALFSAALITRRASSSFTADIDSSLQLFHHIVWRPEVYRSAFLPSMLLGALLTLRSVGYGTERFKGCQKGAGNAYQSASRPDYRRNKNH